MEMHVLNKMASQAEIDWAVQILILMVGLILTRVGRSKMEAMLYQIWLLNGLMLIRMAMEIMSMDSNPTCALGKQELVNAHWLKM